METTLEQTSELVTAITAESKGTISELDLADLSLVGGGLAVLFY